MIPPYVLSLILYVFFLFTLNLSRRYFSWREILFYFLGLSFWMLIFEHLNIFFKGGNYFGYIDRFFIKEFSGWPIMIGLVPLAIILGWFVISFLPYLISNSITSNLFLKAFLTAFLAVNFDFILDPIAVVNKWWVWSTPGKTFLTIPVINWIGWFLVLYFYILVFEKTIVRKEHFFTNKSLSSNIIKIFFKRLILVLLILIILVNLFALPFNNNLLNFSLSL